MICQWTFADIKPVRVGTANYSLAANGRMCRVSGSSRLSDVVGNGSECQAPSDLRFAGTEKRQGLNLESRVSEIQISTDSELHVTAC
jgi:hypothetical protein